MKKIIFAVVATFAISAHAEFVSGNELLKMLKSSNTHERNIGVGYVAGAWDAASDVAICAPNTVTVAQVIDMTVVVLEKYPSDRHKSGDVFVLTAGTEMWPCKNRQKSGTSV